MDFKLCPACQVLHVTGTTCPGCFSPLTLVDEHFFSGKDFGKYRVERVLGMGGMGIVFKAEHRTLHKSVALKIILPGIKDDQFLKRFQREAQILAGLKHPHIVEVHDYDVSSLGIPYYVMEYLEGVTLRSRIQASPKGIPFPHFSAYARQLASGLSHAHRKGVIHRDLKPENVFIVSYEGGSVLKILDFGIAKLVEKSAERTNITVSGTVVGTPHYLAPEQLLGKDLGPWTDEYAFALILAEMITGKNAREGMTLGEIITKEIQKPLSPASFAKGDIPGHVGHALEKATDPDPKKRYPSVQEFVEAVCGRNGLGEGGGPEAATRSMEDTPTRMFDSRSQADAASRKSPLRKLALGILALVLILGGALGGWRLLRKTGGGPSPSTVLLEFKGSMPAPPDAMRILCDQENYLLLEGEAGGIYMLDTSSATALPGRVSLESGETILGALGGGIFLQKDDRLLLRDFHKQKDRDTVWASGIPAAESYGLSPDGAYLASFTGREILLDRILGTELRRIAAYPMTEQLRILAVSGKYLAYAGETRIRFHDLKTGQAVLEAPFSENNVSAVAIQDQTGLAAVGGWFDRVYFFDLTGGRELPPLVKKGQTKSLLFLPDQPTLVIAGEGGIRLWSPGRGVRAAYDREDAVYVSAAPTLRGLTALEDRRNTLDVFAYRPFALEHPVVLGKKEIWAVEASSDGKTVYAGSSEGPLYRLKSDADRADKFELHTLGLTSIREVKDMLVTASDDKTIAVWKLPDMKVLWRSRAHDFLVNHLFYSPVSGALWSASEDGSIKRWSLPNLEETTTLKTGKTGIGSLWMDETRGIGLAGTWANRLITLRRAGAEWKMDRTYPVPSVGLYSMAHLPGPDAVLMVGVRPPALYVYDLARDILYRADDLGQTLEWSTSVSRDTAVVVGNNVAMRCALSRKGDRLSCTTAALINTDFAFLGSAAWMESAGIVAAGTSEGAIQFFKPAGLPWKDLPAYELTEEIAPLEK